MSVVSRGAAIDAIRRFTVTVTMDGADGDALMRLVSVFHRRRMEILESSYERVASTGWMVAIVEATDARVHTTALTLRNTIGVIGCEVAPSVPAAEHVRTPALRELV